MKCSIHCPIEHISIIQVYILVQLVASSALFSANHGVNILCRDLPIFITLPPTDGEDFEQIVTDTDLLHLQENLLKQLANSLLVARILPLNQLV